MVNISPVYSDEDAAGLTKELHDWLTSGHEMLESQRAEYEKQQAHLFDMGNYQAGVLHPMPRPEQPIPENHRFSPLVV